MTQLIIICCYLALLLFLGVFASRFFKGTSSDYMLASHSIGPFLLLMSLFGTTMTAFALVGSTGKAYLIGVGVYGLLASAGGIIHSLCFLIVGVPLWSIGRRNGYRTQIQFFRERLDSRLIGFLLFPILVALVVTYLLVGVVAAGAVVSKVTEGAFAAQGWFEAASFGVPTWLASGVICAVVLVYVSLGGMRGTAWANALQTCFFMVLGLVTFVTIANAIGGTENFLENLKNATAKVPESHLGRAKLTYAKYFSFLLIPLSVAMFPHVFQHWLTARSARTFKAPIILHPIFIMIVWAPCVLIGIWAKGSGLDFAGPNEVLATLVKTHAGDLLGGLLTAGILAAIMSSLDSQFLCIGSIFTNDIVTHYLGKDRISDRNQVWIARAFIISIVAITYYLSQLGYRDVFHMAVWCFSGYAALFPVVLAALYWKRLTAAGALSGILAMVGSWIYLFHESNWGANTNYKLTPFGPDHPIMPVVGIFICTCLAMVSTSLLTKPPSDKTLAKFFDN